MSASVGVRARTWNEDLSRVLRVERAAPAVRTPLHVWPWTRVLEFGTGRGLRTQRCVPQGGRIVAADPSHVTYRCEGACEGGGGACAGEWVAAIDLEEDIQRSYHDGVFTARNGLDRTEITCRSESAGFTQVAVRQYLAMTLYGPTYDPPLIKALGRC